MKTGRSPLKRPPLRNPGESLQEQREQLFDDKLVPYVLAFVLLGTMAAYAWLVHFGLFVMNPAVFSVMALLSAIALFWKFRRVRIQVRQINRGIEAEKAVGQFLEQFRAHGYKVIHDILVKTCDTTFNIDHLLIGPKGIFTIETKSWRKPNKGKCIIVYDGQKVLINGQAPDRNPIAQALGQAAWVRDYLKSCTALSIIPITPIVCYPGWYSEYQQSIGAKVKVVNENNISNCINDSPLRLAPHDIILVESRLTEYIQRKST